MKPAADGLIKSLAGAAGGAPASWIGSLRSAVFGISEAEADFDRRGFQSARAEARERLETAGRSFLAGYHAALAADAASDVGDALRPIAPELRGFAFEGVGMALMLLESLFPWRRGGFRAFAEGTGAPHVYMVHVGAGWAWARLRLDPARQLRRLDPLLGWLAIDGFGFHQGYFHWRRTIERQVRAPDLRGYAGRAFDQGLGRSLWFVHGAEVEPIARAVARFPRNRRADLWSGVGLAVAYAGGADTAALERLAREAVPWRWHAAQGAAFAAAARDRAGIPARHTDEACQVLCATSMAQACSITAASLEGLPASAQAYEVWRQRVRDSLEGGRE